MERFEISGGEPISGELQPAGNKNAALPLLAAGLLSSETLRILNLPDIGDVRSLRTILEGLGADVVVAGGSAGDADGVTVSADRSSLDPTAVDPEAARRIRASVLLAGPLLARFGHVTVPAPGGDVIGRRRLDSHWHALTALGATIEESVEGFRLSAGRGLEGADVLLDEMSVTATENTLLAAVLARGRTTIRNAASEPHVQDLCRALITMGARIDGIGSNVLTIDGVPELGGGTGHIGPDFTEVGSFVGLGAVTPGELRIGPVRHDELRMILHGLRRLGVTVDTDGDWLVVGEQDLEIVPDAGGAIPRLHEAPWPGFPPDLMPIALVVATQARGTVLLHQWMYESRLFYVDRLIDMGARITLADPHRAVVTGPNELRGGDHQSPDIRAGMALLLAALAADGRTTIGNIQQIDRGYERIEERLAAVGARIERQVVT